MSSASAAQMALPPSRAQRSGYVSRLVALGAPVLAPLGALPASICGTAIGRSGSSSSAKDTHARDGSDILPVREEGLPVPNRRPRRRVAARRPRRQRSTAVNHVWAYDFVFDTCADGRTLKCLTVIDELRCDAWRHGRWDPIRPRHRGARAAREPARHAAVFTLRQRAGMRRYRDPALAADGADQTAFIDPGKP